MAAARLCGVTRLADITRLDTLGVSVWQAIRPWSRSVSVHQGKGFDPEQARISAAMEAVECACAEDWRPAERISAAPAALSLPSLAGFAERRLSAAEMSTPIDWTPATRLDAGGEMLVPVACVSLDLTGSAPDWTVRSSNGQGAGDTAERARLKGLCELVERDAFARWIGSSPIDRLRSEILPDGLDLPWLAELRARFSDQRVRLRLYALDGAIDMPIIVAELLDGRSQLRSRAHAAGSCAHPDADAAIAGAVTEAAQARLGQIAGSRDDIEVDAPVELPNFMGFALPRPGGFPARDAAGLRARWAACARWTSDDMAAALAVAGFPGTAAIAFNPPIAGVHVVKMFNPGLVGQLQAIDAGL